MQLLTVNDLVVRFSKKDGLFGKARIHRVLNGVNIAMDSGECLALVGESGSGKSTLGRAILGLRKPDAGSVLFKGKDLYKAGTSKEVAGQISVVFQDYTSSVNPFFTVRDVIAEPLHAIAFNRADMNDYIVTLLEQVGLSGDYLARRPHQLSGGQLQRVCIARAVSTRPSLILLDEAVSSLDVSVSVQILDLLAKLREDYGLSYFFITHDMSVVTYLCDRVLFFNQGLVVEEAPSLEALKRVRHEYSRKLLSAAASLDWVEAGSLRKAG